MIEFNRPQQEEKEKRVNLSYDSQADADLVFYRVVKSIGYPVEIEDEYDDDGEIKVSTASMSDRTYHDLSHFWEEISSKTRKGHIVDYLRIGALQGMCQFLLKDQQEVNGKYYKQLNSSEKLGIQALRECFVACYENKDGYRDREIFHPLPGQMDEIHKLYESLIEEEVEPIQPEGIAILIHQAIQEMIAQTGNS